MSGAMGSSEGLSIRPDGFFAQRLKDAENGSQRVTRDDGLTDAEGEVMDALFAVFNGYAALPKQHPDDMIDVHAAVHRVQDLLAVRIARRAFPLGWPDKGDVS